MANKYPRRIILKENGSCPACNGIGHQNADKTGKLWGWAVAALRANMVEKELKVSGSGRKYLCVTCTVCSGKGMTTRVDCVAFLLEHGAYVEGSEGGPGRADS